MSQPLLIVGASGRAAAESTRRAGMVPWVIDAFGDDDTRRLAKCRVARPYPERLIAESREFDTADWIYVGGLENSPALVDRLASERPLLGVGGRTLRKVRDPWTVRAAVAQDELRIPEASLSEVRFPEIRLDSTGLPRDGTWLCKSRRSAGGLGVAPFDQNAPVQIDGGRYLERRRVGRACGASFLADGRQAWLLGIAEQLLAADIPQRPFLFGGAIGPLELAPTTHERIEAFGSRLAGAFGLTGLFGIDLIVDGDEIWMLEINPRYTASMELLEHAYDRPLIADHVRACRERTLPLRSQLVARATVGKRIVYAGPRGGTVGVEFNERLWKLRGEGLFPAIARPNGHEYGMIAGPQVDAEPSTLDPTGPRPTTMRTTVADIPAAGSIVEPHAPLVTVLTAGPDLVRVAAELAKLAAEIGGEFRATCESP